MSRLLFDGTVISERSTLNTRTNLGGWVLYAHEGRPRYAYNFLGLEMYEVKAPDRLRPGKHQVRVELAYDGDGAGKGGVASLLVDGEKVAEGRVERTQPAIFADDSVLSVGDQRGAPIHPDLAHDGNRFTGMVLWVQIEQGLDDHAHRIEPGIAVAVP